MEIGCLVSWHEAAQGSAAVLLGTSLTTAASKDGLEISGRWQRLLRPHESSVMTSSGRFFVVFLTLVGHTVFGWRAWNVSSVESCNLGATRAWRFARVDGRHVSATGEERLRDRSSGSSTGVDSSGAGAVSAAAVLGGVAAGFRRRKRGPFSA